MVDTVRVGVTGAGGLGMHVSRDLDAVEGAEIAALADISQRSRSRAADAFGVPEANCYDDHESMLDGEGLDGVIIATPHALHYEQTIAALDRGVDTLCEKPLCVDLEHAKDLVRRSDEAAATLMVGYQRHLIAAFRRARDELETQVGEPQFITVEVTQDWNDERRVDKQAVLDIQFEDGAVASVSVSGDTPTVREHFRLGPEGGFYVDGDDWVTPHLTYIDDDGDESEPSLEEYGAPTKAEAFVDVIRNGTEPPAKPRDALKVTAITEAAYESANTGRRVDIDLSSLE